MFSGGGGEAAGAASGGAGAPGHAVAGEAPSLAEAVALAQRAQAVLAAVDVHGEDDRAVLDAAVALEGVANRLAGQQLRLLEEIDRRQAYEHDGAVTTAAWFRARTRADHATAGRQVKAAVRLRHLPTLRDALGEGAVSLAHVTAVTDAAVPRRREAFAACDETLAGLARAAGPGEVRRAVAAVRDQVDTRGDDPPACGDEDGPDVRRDLSLQRTIDGLGDLRATLEPLTAEALASFLDAWQTPDPPGTPTDQRRSAGQRRADALDAGIRAALAAGTAPASGGVAAHIGATIDLCELLDLTPNHPTGAAGDSPAGATAPGAAGGGESEQPAPARGSVAARVAAERAAAARAAADALGQHRPPRLRFTGPTTPAVIRRLARQAKITAILTMGPWRVTNLGRTLRTVPAWMRAALDAVHGHCRGPDCDRPIAWTQAHHQTAWAHGGDTDLNTTIPLCTAHHSLVTAGTWHVTYHPHTGQCTWTGPHGQTIHTHPP